MTEEVDLIVIREAYAPVLRTWALRSVGYITATVILILVPLPIAHLLALVGLSAFLFSLWMLAMFAWSAADLKKPEKMGKPDLFEAQARMFRRTNPEASAAAARCAARRSRE